MMIESIMGADEDEDEAFLKSVTRCEEERRRLHPDRPWSGGFRWFQSLNVVPLERFRPSNREPDGLKSPMNRDR